MRERIVHHIGVTVVGLHIARGIDGHIGRDEAAEHRVVEAGTHIDQPDLGIHLMLGITMIYRPSHRIGVSVIRRIRTTRLSEGIVRK